MKQIALTKNKVVLIDDEDFDSLNQFKWSIGNRYAERSVYTDGKKKTLKMHRLIMNTPEGMETDHINRDPLDNRKENLRICTRTQNQMNRKPNKNSSSEHKGVSWFKQGGKWRADIRVNTKLKYLGLFKKEEEAVLAYDNAAKKYFGEFASQGAQ